MKGRTVLVREVMTQPPRRVPPDALLHEAARLVAHFGASDLMVADDADRLVGVLSEGDLLRAVLPDRDEIYAAGGSVADAMAAFVANGRRLATRRITPYVIDDPITVAPSDHIAAAAAILVDRQIRTLPVVDGDVLVGTVSRADIARAVLAGVGER